MEELERRLTSLQFHPMNEDTPDTVPDGEIEALESALGTQLPDDYRWFLKQYGKGLFKTALVAPTPGGDTVPFMFFYGSNASGSGVLENYTFHEGEFPPGFVPIGEGSFGDLYFLAGNGPHRGYVYYWCHDAGGWDEDEKDYSCFEFVGSSFTDFIQRLVSAPDDAV